MYLTRTTHQIILQQITCINSFLNNNYQVTISWTICATVFKDK